MSNIGIKVAATTDTSKVEQAINALGQKIAQANRVKYQPIDAKSIQDVEKLNRAVSELLKTQDGLRRRVKNSGQTGSAFTDWDWSKMYPHAASRGVAMQSAFERVTGTSFGMSPQAPPPPRAPGGGGGGRGPGMGAGIAQAGLRAAGPAGGVAADALGTGMSSGFGAGLAGLAGGILALGIGKLVGSVMEKIDQAEKNDVDYDRLKRVVGDVGVSFGVLKTVVQTSADNLRITYSEAGKLGTSFAKLANLQTDQYKTLHEELGTGVGFSRAFGMDPSQGVGVMGQMHGIGLTKDAQDSKRFALLIGETIGKSGAFSKADEVMDAIANFATSQTRNGMSAANVAGYAGMFSGMVGSGMPGFDVASSSAMLGRINASLAAGGAKGEASQFFTQSIGSQRGLNPYQMQSWRENGAFGTMDQAFGKGSVYERFMGKALPRGPGSSDTLLQATIDKLRKQYGGPNGENTLELANAAANHFGIGQNQAMGILSIKSGQMGEMQNYADLTKMSASGIAGMSKALYGSASERQSMASEFLGRQGNRAIGVDDAKTIRGAMGSDEDLKKVMATMAAKYGQEDTRGSDIRDSKNALDNIKTALADRLVPLTQGIRDATMLMAGGGKMSPMQVQQAVMESESKDRVSSINNRFNAQTDPLNERLNHLRNKDRSLDPVALAFTYRDKPEILAKKLQERADVQKELVEGEKKLKELTDAKNTALKAETDLLSDKIRQMKEDAAAAGAKPAGEGSLGAAPGGAMGYAPGAGAGAGRGGGYNPLNNTGAGSNARAAPGETDAAMKFFMDKGWSRENASGIVANLIHESKLRPGAVGDNGQAKGVGQWHADRQAAFKEWSGKDLKDSTLEEQYAFVHYELTEGRDAGARRAGRMLKGANAGQSGAIISRYYERPKYRDEEAAVRGATADSLMARKEGAALPGDYAGAGRGVVNPSYNVSADDITVRVVGADGKPLAPPQKVPTTVSRAQPNGRPDMSTSRDR